MTQFFLLLDDILGNKTFLFSVICISLLLRSLILIMLLKRTTKEAKNQRIILSCTLICSMIVDSSWIINLITQLYIPTLDYRFGLFSSRIAWGIDSLFYIFISLFTSVLVQRKRKYYLHQILLILWYTIFFISFVSLAFLNINCLNNNDRPAFEFVIQGVFVSSTTILLFIVILFNLWQVYHIPLPRILKKQLKIFVCGIMGSYLFSLVLQVPGCFARDIFTNSYSAVNLSTIIITIATFFSARKFIGLRFLNAGNKVKSKARINFIDGFKDTLEQLSHATTIKELQHLTQTCLKEMFKITPSRSGLYVRSLSSTIVEVKNSSHIENSVENFILIQHELFQDFIKKHKLFVYDEIAFSNFYENSESGTIILNFLDTINADIFIPICTKQKILGYIIIDRFARPDELYSSVEYDEMVIYANYLANIINLMQTRNLETVLSREKDLQEELYSKHQEINQYKESIHSFLRNQRQKDIGIIFYKNRRFTFGNQAAKEIIDINVNTQQGHPISAKLKDLARKVQEYKSPQSCFIKDKHGQKLVLSAVPHLEQNSIIIMVYYPEVSDLVKKQIESLKDPTKWDYLLYLETTESGKLINQLIPGSGEQFLNFKINLLQSALSRKATLLEMPEDDVIPTVNLLHHISLRETLHVIKLSHPSTNNDVAVKLFGINPIFGIKAEGKPLFEKLDTIGTIFIQNIHFLDLETQNYLAEYLIYGMYRIFKSDQKIACNIRIICSTNKNLHTLVQEGKFSQELFNHLKKCVLSMPSLLTLSENEIHQLADGYTEQAILADDFKNMLELTEKEKHKIALQRPISLHELKSKIQQTLLNKSKKNHIYNETHFDPAYEISDPELIEAARLGKHALRDEKTMTLLWNKFQSQSKIASFLGVNRSSVNRRCQKYKLI